MNAQVDADFVKAIELAVAAIARRGAPPYLGEWAWEDLGELIRTDRVDELLHDPTDRAARAVVAGALWARKFLPIPLTFDEQMETEEGFTQRRLDSVRSYLSELPPEEVPTGQLVWEIHAAGLAGMKDRLWTLADRLGAESAQVSDGLATCAWNLFQLVVVQDDCEKRPWGEIPWAPLAGHEDLWCMIALVDCANLILRNAPGFFGREPSQSTVTVSRRLSASLGARLAQLETLGNVASPFKVARHAVTFLDVMTAGGERRPRLRQLAADFRNDVDATRGAIPEIPLKTLARIDMAGAALWDLAGDPSEAARILKEVAEGSPDDKELWRALATCANAAGDVALTLHAVERATADQPDVVSRLALVFGNERLEFKRKLDLLDETLWQSEARKVDETLLTTLQPFTIYLSEAARRKWYAAVRLASLPELRPLVADWDYVAGAARSALEIDIYDKLLKPVIATGVELVNPDEKLRESWRRAKEGRTNLGGQLVLLRAIARSDPAAREVRTWFSMKCPDLVDRRSLDKFVDDAHRVRESGNEGIHDSVDESVAREALSTTSHLLAFLHRATSQEQQ